MYGYVSLVEGVLLGHVAVDGLFNFPPLPPYGCRRGKVEIEEEGRSFLLCYPSKLGDRE